MRIISHKGHQNESNNQSGTCLPVPAAMRTTLLAEFTLEESKVPSGSVTTMLSPGEGLIMHVDNWQGFNLLATNFLA